tara:strand:- start:15 stop:1523 length:1509 start_codon:yes stop_codon:yes gene_type:complete
MARYLSQQEKEYYEGNNYGSYQFISLEEIINQFMFVYVGEEKIISKARKLDVAFHAQRALQELSFDTFKSIKSQEIILPPSLTMPIPHDYVSYVKLTFTDNAGVEHVLYPAINTSNPLKLDQEDDGSYIFQSDENLVVNGNFEETLQDSPWTFSTIRNNHRSGNDGVLHYTDPNNYPFTTIPDKIEVLNGKLSITTNNFYYKGAVASRAYACWQEIDVSEYNTITLSGKATSAAASLTSIHGNGIIKLGLSTVPGSDFTNPYNTVNSNHQINVTDPDVAVITWDDGNATETEKELTNINVRDHDKLYVVVQMRTIWTQLVGGTGTEYFQTNTIDDIVVEFDGDAGSLKVDPKSSTTKDRFKNLTSRDNLDKYDDRTYDMIAGERYGIHPQNAQINGSFFIDELRGNIHFSSSVSGKTIILKYISDGLGTDSEMQVHKFAEEAMYKYIAHAILSGKKNIPEYIVARFKKEARATKRNAKLRLSNIKLEEITQILRGKSKWIKH